MTASSTDRTGLSTLSDPDNDLEIIAGWAVRAPFTEILAEAERRAVSLDENASPLHFLAEAALRRRYPEFALKCWDRCHDLNSLEYLSMAWACVELNRLGVAEQNIERACLPAAEAHLGEFLKCIIALKKGNRSDAIIAIRKLISNSKGGSLLRQRRLDWLSTYLSASTGSVPALSSAYGDALTLRWHTPIDPLRHAPLFVLSDARSPDFNASSMHIHDYLDVLVVIRLLRQLCSVRSSTLHPSLTSKLFEGYPSREESIPQIDLTVADRHNLWLAPVASCERTAWMIWSGDLCRKAFGTATPSIKPKNLKILFVGLKISDPNDLREDVLDILRPSAPIGCFDRRTSDWLLSLDIEAFVSGPLHPATFNDIEQADPLLRTECLVSILRQAAAVPADWMMIETSAIAATTKQILKSIANGVDETNVRTLWRNLVSERVAETRDRFAPQRRFLLPRPRPHALGSKARNKPSTVNLAICFDRNLEAYVRPLLQSILTQTQARINVCALVRGIDVNRAQEVIGLGTSVRVICMDDYLKSVEVKFFDGKTMSLMDRLFLPDVLPDLDRIVYIDIDTILQSDIAELAAIEPSPRGIAARPTPNVNWLTMAATVERRARELPFAKAESFRRLASAAMDIRSPYFNSGVLVLSLERMRKRNLTRQSVRLVKEVGLRDQDILNLLSGGDYVRLPQEWNSMPYQELSHDAKIIHWAGRKKPWMEGPVLLAERWRRHYASHI